MKVLAPSDVSNRGKRPEETSIEREVISHASCVAYRDQAVLIRGASGSGKSSLALQLISLGAALVSDDRTRLWRKDKCLIADAPDTIRGLIEARGVGILELAAFGPAKVKLLIDMDEEESERLPPLRSDTVLGINIPLVRNLCKPHFPAAILTYLCGKRHA